AITLVATANVSASVIYWRHNGRNTALEYKRTAEADIYGLKIRQMVSPIREHPLSLLRRVREEIVAAGFPNDDNESATAALGTLGAVGFVTLMAIAILNGGRRQSAMDSHLNSLAGIALVLLLVSTVGGFGSLFNVFVTHEIRCYNRI